MPNDPKPSTPLTKEEIAEFIKQAVTAAVAISQASSLAQTVAGRPGASQDADGRLMGQCPECFQRKSACKDKHRKVVVFPRNARHARTGWTGVVLNGVMYKSNDAGHKVVIPENFQIESVLSQWEEAEDTMYQGRSGGASLGNLSPYQNRTHVTSQNLGWR
jgi:hypothetical protein